MDFRVSLGKETTNRFGSRVVEFSAPLFSTTPDLVVNRVRAFPDGDVVVDVDIPPGKFRDAMVLVDDQLAASADALGVEYETYRPVVESNNTMKIKMTATANVPAVGDRASIAIRADKVWFVGDRWGTTWRAA